MPSPPHPALAVLLALLCLGSLVAGSTNAISPDPFRSRFDYKKSLKKPYLFGEGILPHFQIFGDVLHSPDYIRLTPSLQSMKGSIWLNEPIPYPNWQIVITFAATGRGRLGGDGLALWYTSSRLALGDTMGADKTWDGLGILFDTYDNDNKRNNPQIYGILNDGTLSFNPDTDGAELLFNSCTKSFRNSHVPTTAKITYYKNSLKVELDTHAKGKDYQLCFLQEDVTLPEQYYLGVSAATGGLADDHDLISLEFFELDPPPKKVTHKANPVPVPDDNLEQLEKIQEKVQEMRAKRDHGYEENEDFEGFIGKISNMDELLSELSLISTTQQDIVTILSNLGVAVSNLAISVDTQLASNQDIAAKVQASAHTSAPSASNSGGSSVNSEALQKILLRLQELQQDLGTKLTQLGNVREGSGPSASIAASISKVEGDLQQINLRLAKIEQNSGAAAFTNILREELSRLNLDGGSSRSKRATNDSGEEDGSLWIWIAGGAGALLLVGGIAFVASRKSSPKKFV